MWRRLALGLGCLAWVARAGAEEPTTTQIQVACPGWSASETAAFEARTRAELGLRGAVGSVSVQCDVRLALQFVTPDGEVRRADRAVRHPTVDDALDVLDTLVPERGRPTSEQLTPADDGPDGLAEPAPQLPSAAAHSSAPAPTSVHAPRASLRPRALPSVPTFASASESQFGAAAPAAIHLGAGAGLWGSAATFGAAVGGGLGLLQRFSIAMEANALVTLNTPSNYGAQGAGLVAGLRYGLTEYWALDAAAGLGVTRVYTQDQQLRLVNGGGCTQETRGARCWGATGKVASSWALSSGPLRPRLSLEVAWVQHSIGITEDANSNDVFSLARIRPSLLIGVEWRDRTTYRAKRGSRPE